MKKSLLFLALALPFFCYSQSDFVIPDHNSGLELGFFLGGSVYEGDVHCFDDEELNYFSEVGFTIGLQARKQLSNILAVRLNYRYASLKGNDANFSVASDHPRRNFSFSNNIHEIAAIVDWEFLGNNKLDQNGKFRSILSPYIFTGLGIGLGAADTDYQTSSQSIALQERIGIDERDASSVHFTISVGIGLKYYVSESFFIGFQAGARIPLSDYLDGVKESGNPDANDYYGIAGITVGTKLRNKE